MPTAVAFAGLALGAVVSMLTFRLVHERTSATTATALALAIAVFAASVTVVAYPLEKAFSSAFEESSTKAEVRGGENPQTDRVAQSPDAYEAWGPARPMYRVNDPASSPVVNSLIDNPHVGDERTFIVFRDAAIQEDGHWKRSGEVEAGRKYIFRIYVNAAGFDEMKTADLRGSVARVQLPGQVGGAHSSASAGTKSYCGFISTLNAQPSEVWSCGVLMARHAVRLFPDESSVELFNNIYGPTGLKLAGSSVFAEAGQLLGYNQMDGHIPSGFQYALYLFFEVRVERA